MLLKRITLFVISSMLVAAGFPAAAGVAAVATSATPLLQKGPKAIPVNATSASGPKYGLFSCQVGLSEGQCYDPYQMRHAYGVDNLINAGYTGKGRTIIIVDAFQSPNIVEELNTFDSFYGLPGLNGLGNPSDPSLGTFTEIAPQGLTPFDQTNLDQTGWAEEITLDVLWSHAMAPGANIVLDLSKSDQDPDILAATQYAVNHNLGDIISQSFGENESCVDANVLKAEHLMYASATVKGMTIFASSADEGAALQTCDGSSWVKAASSPASDPLVTGVGGTELHAADYCVTTLGCDPTKNPAPGTYQGEIAWNEGVPFGDYQDLIGSTIATGGGFSVLYKAPFFQRLNTHAGKQRGVPDVAYNAAVLHGVLTYADIPGDVTGWLRFGGTSAGSPQWSAITAIADQKAGHRLGFLNAALYLWTLIPSKYNSLFHDITTGNNSAMEFDSDNNPVTITGFSAGTGWDAATGLGSPKADALVNFLTKFASPNDGNQAIQDTELPSSNRHGQHRMSH